jgi:hypothetical protein
MGSWTCSIQNVLLMFVFRPARDDRSMAKVWQIEGVKEKTVHHSAHQVRTHSTLSLLNSFKIHLWYSPHNLLSPNQFSSALPHLLYVCVHSLALDVENDYVYSIVPPVGLYIILIAYTHSLLCFNVVISAPQSNILYMRRYCDRTPRLSLWMYTCWFRI